MSVHFVQGLSNTWNSILSTNTKVKNLGNVISAILLMPLKWAFRFRISYITKKFLVFYLLTSICEKLIWEICHIQLKSQNIQSFVRNQKNMF